MDRYVSVQYRVPAIDSDALHTANFTLNGIMFDESDLPMLVGTQQYNRVGWTNAQVEIVSVTDL